MSAPGFIPPWQDMATNESRARTKLPYVRVHKDDHERGHVYFIEAGGLIKIGFSGNLTARLKNLRSTSPVEITVLCTSYAHKKFERKLHKQFAHLRAHGEWFRKAPELMEIIKNLK